MAFRSDLKASRAPALALILMGIVWASMSAQIPVLKARIGADDATFGVMFLISNIGALTAMWLAQRVDRRFGRGSLLIVSVGLGLAMLMPALATGLVGFGVALLVMAMLSGVSDILLNARIAEAEASEGRPLMNLNHALYSFAFAGAALAVGWSREAGAGPVAVAICVAVLACVAAPWLDCPHRHTASAAGVRPARVSQAFVWLGGLVVLAAYLTEQTIEGWSALHLERTLGGSPAEGALGPALLGLTMGFGRLFGQGLARRVTDTVLIALALAVSAAGLAVAAVAPSLALAYLGFAMLGLGVSVVLPLTMALVGRTVAAERRVAVIGQVSVIGYGAYFVGPLLIGTVSETFGLRVAFLIVSAILLLAAVVIVPAMARRGQPAA